MNHKKTENITTMANLSLNNTLIMNQISLCKSGLAFKMLLIIVAEYGTMGKTGPGHTNS